MSKPLELTIYPRPNPPMPSTLRDEKGWDAYYDAMEQRRQQILKQQAKRLTEAELCAEWWRHHATFDQLTEGYGVESFGTGYICGGIHEDRARDQLNTLRRFATRPHYFEATEPESDTE